MGKYWKDVIRPGTYRVNGRTFKVTESDVNHWKSSFEKMRAQGIHVPVPWEHPEDPADGGSPLSEHEKRRQLYKMNAGWVSDVRVGDDGTLQALLDIGSHDEAKRLESVGGFVSPRFATWQDGDGNVWNNAMCHVAITPRPVNHRQGRDFTPTSIAMGLDDEEFIDLSIDMAVRHAPKGGITINGKYFKGGEFIPSSDFNQATPEQKRKIDGGNSGKTPGKGKLSAEEGVKRRKGKDDSSRKKVSKDAVQGKEPEGWPEGLWEKTRKRPQGQGGQIQNIQKDEVEFLLNNGRVAFISGGPSPHDPEGMSEDQIKDRERRLERILKRLGFMYRPSIGKYGEIENSFTVFVTDARKKPLFVVSEALNQDSFIFSDSGKAQMIYTKGDHKGHALKAGSWEKIDDSSEDNFTKVSLTAGSIKMSWNIDWDNEVQAELALKDGDMKIGDKKKRKDDEVNINVDNDNDEDDDSMLVDDDDDVDVDIDMDDDDDEDEETDVDDDETDEDIPPVDEDNVDESGELSEKVISALRDIGAIVPEGTKFAGDLKPVLAALLTYQHLKGSGSSDEDSDGMQGDESGEEEQEPMTVNLSQLINEDPVVGKVFKENHENKLEKVNARIDSLFKSGRCTKPIADKLRESANAVEMSFDNPEPFSAVIDKIQLLEEMPENSIIGDKDAELSVDDDHEEQASSFLADSPDGDIYGDDMTDEQVNEAADLLQGI